MRPCDPLSVHYHAVGDAIRTVIGTVYFWKNGPKNSHPSLVGSFYKAITYSHEQAVTKIADVNDTDVFIRLKWSYPQIKHSLYFGLYFSPIWLCNITKFCILTSYNIVLHHCY